MRSPDGYSTPPEAVDFLLQHIVGGLPMPILDPGCGSGRLLQHLSTLPAYQPSKEGEFVFGGCEHNPERAKVAREEAGPATVIWAADYMRHGPWTDVPWGTIILAPPVASPRLWWLNAGLRVRPGGLVCALVPLIAVPYLRPEPMACYVLPGRIDYGGRGGLIMAWVCLRTLHRQWRTT